MDAFETLVRLFYEGVRCDEVLWPMYGPDDLEEGIVAQPLSRPVLGAAREPQQRRLGTTTIPLTFHFASSSPPPLLAMEV